MSKNNIYSCTSNIAKLLKHLDTLQGLQRGRVAPIMIHTIPTHRCQLNCIHCCFKNRKNKQADMPIDQWMIGMEQFRNLGTKSLEFTGGGEPTTWPYINEAIHYAKSIKYYMGMITNCLNPENIDRWDHFDWVRISLNTLDYKSDIDLSRIEKSGTFISFCYIWNNISPKNIEKIIDFSNYYKIVCRLAPDCIKPLDEIDASVNEIRNVLKGFPDNKYVQLSDFNIDTYRKNNDCRIHMIKPCFYLDGWVYACPSAELAMENEKQIQPKVRICRYDDIIDFYNSPKAKQPMNFDCSYCKYVQQQELLEALFMETSFNEFA